jgi:hypothetical protein
MDNLKTHQPLHLQTESRHSLHRRLERSQSQYGRFGEETNLQPLPGFQTQIFQHVAQPKHYTISSRDELQYSFILVFSQNFQNVPLHIAKLYIVRLSLISCPRIYCGNLHQHKRKVHLRFCSMLIFVNSCLTTGK